MPNYFQLRSKSDGQVKTLDAVDFAIARFFGVPCDEKYYVAGWYNVIGFILATTDAPLGSIEIRHAVSRWYDGALDAEERSTRHVTMLAILLYLETFYESSAWATIGRRN